MTSGSTSSTATTPPRRRSASASIRGRYPDLVLDKEKFEAFEKLGMSHDLVHGFKGGATDVVRSIKSTDEMGAADMDLAEVLDPEDQGTRQGRQAVLPRGTAS